MAGFVFSSPDSVPTIWVYSQLFEPSEILLLLCLARYSEGRTKDPATSFLLPCASPGQAGKATVDG